MGLGVLWTIAFHLVFSLQCSCRCSWVRFFICYIRLGCSMVAFYGGVRR